jgi:formylglycine-generating enzyme required for sulfatase activity
MSKPTIFISYSHKDLEWRDKLATHLRALQLQDSLTFWTDEAIGIGDAWFEKIQDAMNAASVAVVLVSPDFLASEFVIRKEVRRLLERREQDKMSIFPILVRPCVWELVPWLSRLQMRPANAAALSAGSAYQIDADLTAIVKEIDAALRRAIEPGNKPNTPPPASPIQPAAPTFCNSIGMEFILIHAGEFRMGASDGADDEKPVHRVRITRPFYLAKYPTTQAQWEAVIESNPSRFPGDPNRPVETVSWDDAQNFLQRLSAKEGKSYRLPTEAEWEYAARAGTTTAYCFGDDVSLLREYGWYTENSGGRTRAVGQLEANVWGLHDMHGNVWEWVQDWYADNYYQQSGIIDPKGAEEGKYRVVRGGSWRDDARYLRVSARGRNEPGYRLDTLGFRCAV